MLTKLSIRGASRVDQLMMGVLNDRIRNTMNGERGGCSQKLVKMGLLATIEGEQDHRILAVQQRVVCQHTGGSDPTRSEIRAAGNSRWGDHAASANKTLNCAIHGGARESN